MSFFLYQNTVKPELILAMGTAPFVCSLSLLLAALVYMWGCR